MSKSTTGQGVGGASRTLLVGGAPRSGTDHCTVDALIAAPARQYREIVLQTALEQLNDAWTTLRLLWSWLEVDGVLSVSYAPRDTAAFRDIDAENLVRLASFEIVGSKRTEGNHRLHGKALPRPAHDLSCTVVVPCRNEVDNVGPLVARLPTIGIDTELLFVDGASTDGTVDRIRELIQEQPERDIKLLQQKHSGGKAAAVFQGFDAARGEVVMILDADMTVAPEDLPRFYLAIAEGIADFANGSRFAYPMQAGAMPPLNKVGNRAFGSLLSWAVDSHITDSLCGTKAFRRRDWTAIRAAGALFGGHDPWGDFDLLLGAAYAKLRIVDVPVRYYARVAGESKMRPIRHGLSLARTLVAGVRRLKLGSVPQSGV